MSSSNSIRPRLHDGLSIVLTAVLSTGCLSATIAPSTIHPDEIEANEPVSKRRVALVVGDDVQDEEKGAISRTFISGALQELSTGVFQDAVLAGERAKTRGRDRIVLSTVDVDIQETAIVPMAVEVTLRGYVKRSGRRRVPIEATYEVKEEFDADEALILGYFGATLATVVLMAVPFFGAGFGAAMATLAVFGVNKSNAAKLDVLERAYSGAVEMFLLQAKDAVTGKRRRSART